MKNIVILVLMMGALLSGTPLLQDKKGQKTDFAYYNDKYEDLWEKMDSCVHNQDTFYLYKLGGQKFVFKANGDKYENTVSCFKN